VRQKSNLVGSWGMRESKRGLSSCSQRIHSRSISLPGGGVEDHVHTMPYRVGCPLRGNRGIGARRSWMSVANCLHRFQTVTNTGPSLGRFGNRYEPIWSRVAASSCRCSATGLPANGNAHSGNLDAQHGHSARDNNDSCTCHVAGDCSSWRPSARFGDVAATSNGAGRSTCYAH